MPTTGGSHVDTQCRFDRASGKFHRVSVQSGRYQNASEVMREGLRLIGNRENEEAARLEALRAAVQLGINSLDRGEFKEFEDASTLITYLDNIADRDISSSVHFERQMQT